jgi:hypothetical protein
LHRDGKTRRAILSGAKSVSDTFILDNYFEVAVQSDPPLWTSAVVVSKKAINAIGGFPVGVTAGEDLLTWARLAIKFRIAYFNVAKAYFWEPLEISDRPGRVPQMPDIVGHELVGLACNDAASQHNGLKEYAGLWFRMRGVIFLRLGQRKDAIREFGRSLKFSKLNLKLLTLAGMSLLPTTIAKRLFSAIKAASGR